MNHIDANLTISPDVDINVSLSNDIYGQVDVGTIAYVSGTTNYDILSNKPRIENIELKGNKTFVELGLAPVTPQDIDKILYG